MTSKTMMVLAAGLTLSVQAAVVQNYWYPVEGVSDGAFTDSAHWKLNATTPCDHIPGAYDDTFANKGDNAFFRTSDQDSSVSHFTVAYPDSEYKSLAGVSFQVNREAGITLKGKRLVYPRPTDNNKIDNNGFQVQAGMGTLRNVFQYDFNGNPINTDLFAFDDFEVTVTNYPAEHRLEFVRGKFDFTAGAYKKFFWENAGAYADVAVQVDRDAYVRYNGGSTVFNAPSTNNLVRVDGGKLAIETYLQLPDTVFGMSCGLDRRLLQLSAVNGGELAFGTPSASFSVTFGSTKQVGTTNLTVRVLADAGRLVQYASTSCSGAGRHEFVIRNGSTAFFNNTIKLGNYAAATGVVSVADSTVALGSTGGEWVLGGADAAQVAAGAWGELTVARSTLMMTNSIAVTSGEVTLTDVDVVFGAAKKIYSRDQRGGPSTLAMDGVGFKVFPTSTTEPFGGFTSATVGARGLSVESAKDITISQPLTAKAGTAPTLTLAGAGTKTLSAEFTLAKVDVLEGGVVFGGTCEAEVVSTNGATVSFGGHATAEKPLAALSLGSETATGCLKVSPGEKIHVADGTKVSLANLKLIVAGGALTPGQTVSLVCGGGISQEVREAWTRALVDATFDAGYTWGVREVSGGGVTELIMEAVPDVPLVITVDAGKDVHDTNILFTAGQTLRTVLAADTELELNGKIGYGRLVQASGGRTRVTGSSNELSAGVEIDGGALEFASPASIGTRSDSALDFKGGAFAVSGSGTVPGVATLNTATKETPMVFKTDGDVTMPLPALTQGKIAKTGDGRLTFLVPDGNKTYSNMGWGWSNWTSYDEANGTLLPVAANNCGTFDVSGGTLALKNTGATVPTLTINNGDVMVKRREGMTSKAIRFELDHVGLTTTYNYNQDKCALSDGTAAVPTILSLKNKACYSSWFHYAYKFCTNEVDGATRRTTSSCIYSDPNYDSTPSYTSYWHVVNGGRCEFASVQARMPSVSVYDNAVFAKNAANEPTVLSLNAEQANACQQLLFRNKSLLSLAYIGVSGADQTVTRPDSQRVQLTFDDAEWFAGTGARVIGSSNIWVDVTVTGGGLRLNPPADATWTLYTPVTGDAGIAKGGAGTLVVEQAFRKHASLADPVTLAYEGRTTVTGGTLKVTNGADAHFAYGLGGGATLDLDGAEISGADLAVVGDGTLVNATLTRPTLRPAYADGTFATVTFGAGTSLSGRALVDFGRTAADPLPTDLKDVVVARWTGTKPDAGRWRSANLGDDGYKMTFVANDDGTVTGTCERKGGLMLIFR